MSDTSPQAETDRDARPLRETKQALLALAAIMFVGVVGIGAYASQFPNSLLIASTGAMASGAALLLGSLLGFLFGIPHTVLPVSQADSTSVEYMPNTNLEQISDWLTKILVGVGLTTLSSAPKTVQGIANFIAAGMGNPINGANFAFILLIYFLVCGFLLPSCGRACSFQASMYKLSPSQLSRKNLNRRKEGVPGLVEISRNSTACFITPWRSS